MSDEVLSLLRRACACLRAEGNAMDALDAMQGSVAVRGVDGTNRTNGANATNGRNGAQPAVKRDAPSKWREISGITVENEGAMTPAERRAAIRKLKDVVEREIREELNAANEDVELMVERTHLWEPTLAICRKLEIGPAVLSRLMRELTGISTSQMVDKIRGEGLKEKLRENLIAFVLKNFKRPGASHAGTAVNFWGKLRAMRREAKFSYASWAIDLGFANYTRFYRACLLCFRQTPTQIEDEILRGFEEWFTLAKQLLARNEAKLKWTDENLKHRPPYSDGWTAALKARGDWIARMRRELELDETVIAISLSFALPEGANTA